MRYFFKNLHIFVFTFLSVFAALWVAQNTDRTTAGIRPLVEDAVELSDVAEGAYHEIKSVSLSEIADEFVSIYVDTMRLPTTLFERLSDRLGNVEADLKRKRASTRTEANEPVVETEYLLRTHPLGWEASHRGKGKGNSLTDADAHGGERQFATPLTQL
ncbi:hypothetical protein FIV00_19765 [Labrenzia sp. THAF82]|uniref:hypothetical protein n=1 Tax=Labrenzia sp. THAF82 TaxID=2587861 RepID=UPI001267E45A|nr:hypothetical protein [Labrenzia sp. THAF82]QFT32737.1 hypothetical protein FIV00_19765 [Labrenzia sp. THAF82]